MRIAEFLARLMVWASMAIMLLMALHVSASVISRWTFGSDIPLTLELTAYYYMVALTFLPLALIDLTHRHIRAEFLYALMPRAVRYVLALAIRLSMVGFLGFLTWRTWLSAQGRTRVGEEIVSMMGYFPIWPARWIVPVGLAMATIAAAVLVFRALLGRDDGPADDITRELDAQEKAGK
jgi:TRAP-type C4-dicarboxylate transport system permease small subunit